ncbi:hypothetical protein D3C75_581940 [compost metagenome]
MVYGVKQIAKELGCSPLTIRRIIHRHPDFPAKKIEGLGTFEFSVEQCKLWWEKNRTKGNSKTIPANSMQQSKMAEKLGVSLRLVLVWRQNGLKTEKLADGTVWINVDEAREWFLKQEDERTQKHAQKL